MLTNHSSSVKVRNPCNYTFTVSTGYIFVVWSLVKQNNFTFIHPVFSNTFLLTIHMLSMFADFLTYAPISDGNYFWVTLLLTILLSVNSIIKLTNSQLSMIPQQVHFDFHSIITIQNCSRAHSHSSKTIHTLLLWVWEVQDLTKFLMIFLSPSR